jgi:hypothetical protein
MQSAGRSMKKTPHLGWPCSVKRCRNSTPRSSRIRRRFGTGCVCFRVGPEARVCYRKFCRTMWAGGEAETDPDPVPPSTPDWAYPVENWQLLWSHNCRLQDQRAVGCRGLPHMGVRVTCTAKIHLRLMQDCGDESALASQPTGWIHSRAAFGSKAFGISIRKRHHAGAVRKSQGRGRGLSAPKAKQRQRSIDDACVRCEHSGLRSVWFGRVYGRRPSA